MHFVWTLKKGDRHLHHLPEVVALAEQLRAGAARRQAAPGRASSVSIAVLPFRNLSTDTENACFADGITEDVIAHLAKIRALTVISPTSVMQLKDRRLHLEEIARTLGATKLLEGSVRRSGDRIRIVAQLIDVDTDQRLWAETYDRRMTDIFSIQTEVALQIAAALEAEMSPDERLRVQREPTKDVLAYQLFLQGRQWLGNYTVESMTRAIEYFDRAIARDPEFALAYANLAMAYAELGEIGVMPPEVAYPRAGDAAATSLRLDPELGAAHCAVGYLKALHDFDWIGAEQGFKRALELSPSSADTYDLYGRLCSALERSDDAIELLMRAQELDPLAHRVDLATASLRAGRFEEAILRAEHAAQLDPFDRARATLGWAYFLSGRKEEGLTELERAVSLSRGIRCGWHNWARRTGWPAMRRKQGRCSGRSSRRRKASTSRHTISPTSTRDSATPTPAMDWLERAVARRTGPAYGIKGSFLFASLHAHPRFRALLRQMNLE